KAIGGDVFGNREGLLPKKTNRTYYEADLNYNCGNRNADRLIMSNDGLVYVTKDHYQTFTQK
ncbi:ribonuclease domain-containing protein, partial [Elizabethkingia miricola]